MDFAEQPGGETYLYSSADGIDQLTVHQLGQLPVDKGTTLHLKFDQEKNASIQKKWAGVR